MLADRGVVIDHPTLYRPIQAFAPELDRRRRPHRRMATGSRRVDETCVKVKRRWMYPHRAVDAGGQAIDCLLSAKQDAAAARRFFHKGLRQAHTVNPRPLPVDKNAAYPSATKATKTAGELWRFAKLHQVKYINNIIEQDHRRIKRMVRPGPGLRNFHTARRPITVCEIMAMVRKGPVATSPVNDMPPRRSSLPACSGWPPDDAAPAAFRARRQTLQRSRAGCLQIGLFCGAGTDGAMTSRVSHAIHHVLVNHSAAKAAISASIILEYCAETTLAAL